MPAPMSSLYHRPPKLPLDVIRYLLDILYARQDYESLKVFALTCSAYSHPARRLLFHKVALRLDTQPSPTPITDIARRIQGLCVMFTRWPQTRSYVQRFELLDSYPVYNSDWITQQPGLAHLVSMLANVRQLTFGCSVGYLDALRLPPELMQPLEKLIKQPQLRILALNNLHNFPQSFLKTHATYVFITNAHTALHSTPFHSSRVKYLNVRTESLADAQCIGHLIQMHRRHLKMLKWRCWEDPRTPRSHSFPGGSPIVDFSTLRALKKIVLRVSFGATAADLSGFILLMSRITQPSPLAVLELNVACPDQRTDTAIGQVHQHQVWRKLAEMLEMSTYRSVRRVALTVTAHQFKMGQNSTSLVELRKGLERALSRVISIPTLHFTLHTLQFFPHTREDEN